MARTNEYPVQINKPATQPDASLDSSQTTTAEIKPSNQSALLTLPQILLTILVVTCLLYFGRPVLLPVFMAIFLGMILKPLISFMARCYLPNPLSAAIVLSLLVAVIGYGFTQLGEPAVKWINDAPKHMTELRQRVKYIFPVITNFNQATEAMNNMGASEAEKKAEQKESPSISIEGNRGGLILNWTGGILILFGETLFLLYLLLASGDLFTQKLVHVMHTLSSKKRAVRINREIQNNISYYLATVTLINLGLGFICGVGFYLMGVPNAAMWGVLVAALNYIPYVGAIVGVLLLTIVGMLTFNSLFGILPALWYLLLNLFESNLITPILLGRKFSLNPVVIFISFIFWGWLWGVPGALLSVPILVSIKVVCDHFPSLDSLSELLAK